MCRHWSRPTRWLTAVVYLSIVTILPRTGLATSLTGKDAQIIGKILGFLDPPRSGSTVAVVYSSDDPASQADAVAIVALFGGGPNGGSNMVTAEALPASSLGHGERYAAVIVAAGTPMESIAAAIQSEGALCITGDVTLVQAGACALAVQSDPRVEIMLNRKAAASAGISFATAFRMLIHEI